LALAVMRRRTGIAPVEHRIAGGHCGKPALAPRCVGTVMRPGSRFAGADGGRNHK
jgi:hypothetical protein